MSQKTPAFPREEGKGSAARTALDAMAADERGRGTSRTRKGYRSGEGHHRAKLTANAVRDIRQNFMRYVRGYNHWARKYGVHLSTIRDVVSYRTWWRA